GGRGEDGVVAVGQSHDGGLDRLGQLVAEGGGLRQQDLAYAGDVRGGVGGGLGPLADDEDVDVAAQLGGGGDGLVGGLADGGAVVIGDDENGHYSTPAVLSLATRSAASVTFTPAPRLGGSVTFWTVRRGAVSTP